MNGVIPKNTAETSRIEDLQTPLAQGSQFSIFIVPESLNSLCILNACQSLKDYQLALQTVQSSCRDVMAVLTGVAHGPSPSSGTRARLDQNNLARSVCSRDVHTRNNQLMSIHPGICVLRYRILTFSMIILARSRGERPRTSARPCSGNSALYVLPQDNECSSLAQSR